MNPTNLIPSPIRAAIALSPIPCASALGAIGYSAASLATGIACKYGSSEEMCDAFSSTSKIALACVATAAFSVACVLSFKDMRS